MNDATDKKSLRIRAASLRDSIPVPDRMRKSAEIERLLFEFAPFARARTVMFYVAFRSEVFTEQMIRRAIREGRRVVVPVVVKGEKELLLSELKNFDAELRPGSFGILEPSAEFVRPVDASAIEFVAAPGLAFDRSGSRLGYGGGYYDRLASRLPEYTFFSALAFTEQIVDAVPHSPEDASVQAVITDQTIISCK